MSRIPLNLPKAVSLTQLLKNPGKWYVLATKQVDESIQGRPWDYSVRDREAIIEAADAWQVFCPQRRVGNTLEWLGIALSEPPSRRIAQPPRPRFAA